MTRLTRGISATVTLSFAVSMLGTMGGELIATAASGDTHAFEAGNIISDESFYDSSAMSVEQIQTFLESKEKSCTAKAGADTAACLKLYRATTIAKSSQSGLCSGYKGGVVQSAAQIIAGVADSCGISPKVLLVLLEKEQGLVSAVAPGQGRFDSATGMGCPDTAACASQYKGFFNQVYGAARQFKLYKAHPDWYAYQAGSVNSIAYAPYASCGRKDVYIRNQATAGLYNYTPYVPSAASLAAGYGATGNKCDSYGNRNFAYLMQDWFGSSTAASSEATAAITTKWKSLGGSSGSLGAGTGQATAIVGGAFQSFRGGQIYWSSAGGARVVWGAISQKWGARGGASGVLGYPLSDEVSSGGGVYQQFQGGRVYWSYGNGAYVVWGAISQKWGARGGASGVLGYPLSDEVSSGGGVYQQFQGGRVYWSYGNGAYVVWGAVFNAWSSHGGSGGVLGYPLSDEIASGGGVYQQFQGGRVYWSPGQPAHIA